jgi:hypothetical protein
VLRSVAVTRIQDGLGFATRQSDKIILRLQEAQRELELGKTLPKFLLREDQTFTLLAGTHSVALPTEFARLDDDNPPYFTAVGATIPTFVTIKRSYKDAVEANASDTPASPKVAVIRYATMDFIVPADTDYGFTWNYYFHAGLLTSDVENRWLQYAPEWLIGEAGYRMAFDARDKDAMANFDSMRKMGRAAVFGEIVVNEESSGPFIMGASKPQHLSRTLTRRTRWPGIGRTRVTTISGFSRPC